jgi:hypothetical protein
MENAYVSTIPTMRRVGVVNFVIRLQSEGRQILRNVWEPTHYNIQETETTLIYTYFGV